VLILNYHRVGVPPPGCRIRGAYVTPEILAWQLCLLKARGAEFVRVSDGVRRGCAPGLVALTFDDGYSDNLELGLPVIKAAGAVATVYAVTGDVGKKALVWPEARNDTPADLMGWEDLRRLESEGWEIGSHAAGHVYLARRAPEEQRALVARSWSDIEANLGHPPASFAYPYGSYDDNTVKILQDLGCAAAVTTERGVNGPGTHPLKLFRLPAKGFSFRHKLRALSLLWRK
jgi:peptidoglycan/xylan/chitin deacetylase (PgdA/CDA1 family)